jgi:arsenate reductase-like glutaredoxin family protein
MVDVMERKITQKELEYFYENVDLLCEEIFSKKENNLQEKLDSFIDGVKSN